MPVQCRITLGRDSVWRRRSSESFFVLSHCFGFTIKTLKQQAPPWLPQLVHKVS